MSENETATDECAAAALAGGHNVVVSEDRFSSEYHRARMNRVMCWIFGGQIPEPKKEAPWSPNPVSIAEF